MAWFRLRRSNKKKAGVAIYPGSDGLNFLWCLKARRALLAHPTVLEHPVHQTDPARQRGRGHREHPQVRAGQEPPER